jgi:predicted Rossmann fold flavoprotein
VGQRVIVVGGGAAGLMAAGRAAELCADVVLLEKGARFGRKLMVTGNGHCNLTNSCPHVEFIKHLGPTGAFMRNALARFGVPELLEFMQHLGVPTVTKRDGRVYPASLSARDVLGALVCYNQAHGVHFACNCAADSLEVQDGAVVGVYTRPDRAFIPADAIVLATGGKSWAHTGSNGDGYVILGQLGHRIIAPHPGLVPLVVAEVWVKSLEGIALPAVGISALQGKQRLARLVGEILFTNDGLSGPAVLDASSRISGALELGPVQLTLDLFPQVTCENLVTQLSSELHASGNLEVARILQSHLPRRLALVMIGLALKSANSKNSPENYHFPASQFTAKQIVSLAELCKRLPFHVLATRPFSEAMITVGGVDCGEVDPLTFGSKRVKGLYISGELLDIAGDTGGYNLQIAFTSGRLAGEAAARVINP